MTDDPAREAMELLNEEVQTLYEQGRFPEALERARRAVALARLQLGKDHPDTATYLNNLGALLRATGDLAAALPCFREALGINCRSLGVGHPDCGANLNNLGTVLQDLGNPAQARRCLERALAINRVALGEDHPDTLHALNNLGVLLWKVPDNATRDLMEDFYARLLAGRGKADALRDAHLALRQTYSNPYYWGAFICQGDPARLGR